MIKDRIRRLLHIHKHVTLLIYPPRKNDKNYMFLLQCACGSKKSPKLPDTIMELFVVNSKTEQEKDCVG